MKKLKFEQKQVRKKLDVGIISAGTIEALLKYLQLGAGASDKGLQRRLTLDGDRRKTIGRNTLRPQQNSDELRTEQDENDRIKEEEEDGLARA